MASRSVNKVILIGNLGKDAETRFTPNGTAKTTFSVATSRRWKDEQSGEWKEETDWHNIVAWRSENVAQYLVKGKKVYVEGRLLSRSYDDKDGVKKYITEVVANDIMLLGGRDAEQAGEGGHDQPVSMPRAAQGPRPVSRPVAPPAPAPHPEPFGDQGITDDDVPF